MFLENKTDQHNLLLLVLLQAIIFVVPCINENVISFLDLSNVSRLCSFVIVLQNCVSTHRKGPVVSEDKNWLFDIS